MQQIKTRHILPVNVTIDDCTVLINMVCPDLRGWTKTVTRGGVLHNASVEWVRNTALFSGTIICFIDIDRGVGGMYTVDFSFTGWLAEYDHTDERYYAFDGSYLANFATLNEVRIALRELSHTRS